MLRFRTINNTHYFIELLPFARQMAMTPICILLTCLFVDIAMAECTPTKIGNPLLARYPTSGDPQNSRARSILEMHYFNNRIYIGHGDLNKNSGPTDVWIYNGTSFVKEYTVDEESIYEIFEFENKLFIPGNDARGYPYFGNVYINDPNRYPNPGWIKLSTLPGSEHCHAVALFKGKLYASINTDGSTPNRVLVSADMGLTWETFIPEHCGFVVFDDFMFFAGDYHNYRYDGHGEPQSITVNLISSIDRVLVRARYVRFQNGVLYSKPDRRRLENAPLYFLHTSEIKNGGSAMIITKFATDKVRDIVVRDTTCYVMTAEEITQDVAYKGHIYSSTNLINWCQVTEFTLPGVPLSFEIMNKKFYIGLGCRYKLSSSSLGHIFVGPESGSIWEIVADMDPPLKATDPSPADGVAIRQRNPFLSWTPGCQAIEHDVYFGTDFEDVNSADIFDISGIYRGRWSYMYRGLLIDPNYATEELNLDQTYYWRIDGIDNLEPDSPYKGDVWSFTVTEEATVEFQVSASDDDGYATDSTLLTLGANFLKIGSSSFSKPPYYMSGMVFRNINIPRGNEVVEAHLRIRSYRNRLTGNVYGKIEAEATDNADAFGESRHIGSLPTTEASVDWNHEEPWTEDTWYDSPNIAAVIQEVINREGWSPGNSLAILYSTWAEGDYRSFSSYDQGSDYAPKLKFTYVPE